MSSMTPLYDSVLATDADGAVPAVPRHPDIYQQLCREHSEVSTWGDNPLEAEGHAPTLAAAPPVPSVESGWFETSDHTGRPPTSGQAGWFAA